MGRLITASCFALVLWAPVVGAAGSSVRLERMAERTTIQGEGEGEEEEHVVSVLFLAHPHAGPEDGIPLEDVPWCASADDPRCAPLPANADPRNPSSQAPLNATNETARQPVWSRGTTHGTAATGLSAQPGRTARVERPPR